MSKSFQNGAKIVKNTPKMMPGSARGGLWGAHRLQEGKEMGPGSFFMANFGRILVIWVALGDQNTSNK